MWPSKLGGGSAEPRHRNVNGVNAADGTYTTLRSLNFTGTIVVRPGYDDVTGLGTPNGPEYLRMLAH